MLVGEDEDTRSLQRETSEISSLVNEFPKNIHILVVDTNFTNLLNMKQIMRQNAYQVTIVADAKKALAFLKSCTHKISIVVWDFHMPGINGTQALKDIGSKMDLPVVIMSDDNRTDSVMEAIINGACDYVMKPVRKEIIANIWQHIVRKRMMSGKKKIMSKPEAPVQSDLAQSAGLDKGKAVSDQEQSIKRKEENEEKRTRAIWTEVSQLLQPHLVQTNELHQHSDGSTTIYQANGEGEKAAKIPRRTWAEDIQLVQADLVQTNGLDEENDDGFNFTNQENDELNIEKKEMRYQRRERMTWGADLHQKFLEAIEIVGGIRRASPKLLHECLEEMNVQGLTRANVGSHLQKHRLTLEESQIPKHTQMIGLSTAYRSSRRFQIRSNKALLRKHSNNVLTAPSSSYLHSKNVQTAPSSSSYLHSNNVLTAPSSSSYLHSNNVQTAPSSSSYLHSNNVQTTPSSSSYLHSNNVLTAPSSSYLHSNNVLTAPSPSYLTNGRAVNPIQQNQYQNGYLPMNNNQLITNQLPPLPYVDHRLQQQQPQKQQYQSSSHQFNYVMSNEEPGQASGNYVDHLLQQHQPQPQKQQYQSASHLFDYVVGNEELQQASGTSVGHSLHQNQPQQPQYQSSSYLFNNVVGNEELQQASGTSVGHSLHQNQQQPQQYQSSHQFNYVMSNEEPGQASGTYVDHLLDQHQPQPQQHQSSHQFNYVMSNEEPEQASGIGVTGLDLTYPSVPQPQQSQSSHQFNYVMSNEEPQQASGIGVTGLELTYPSVSYDPFEGLISG